MTIDLALAGRGQNREFVAEIAPDRPGLRDHRDRLEPHAREGPQIGDEHPVVGMPGAGLVEVERIGVLHEELPRPHGAEPRSYLVPEFPLDVVEVQRQILVRSHIGAKDLGDHLLVGGSVEEIAPVPILDAQHFLAVVLVASAFAPQFRRLQRGH